MFKDCSGLTTLDVSNWDVSRLKIAGYMFNGCSSLTTLDLSNWHAINLLDTSYMFNGCSGLTTLDLRGFDFTHSTGNGHLWAGCSSLTTLIMAGAQIKFLAQDAQHGYATPIYYMADSPAIDSLSDDIIYTMSGEPNSQGCFRVLTISALPS